jgi:hypothetical protein
MAAVALLDALRALTSFSPPPAPAALPAADLSVLGDVLEAHGLAPLASYQLETTRLGAGVPHAFRERLLVSYQGVVNDNVLRLVTLRGVLRAAPDVPAVLLGAAAYVEWLYPHMAFRPVGDLRVAIRPADRPRFLELLAAAGGLSVQGTEHDGRSVVLTDGRITIAVQDALWPGGPAEGPLFERGRPYRVFGPQAMRPSPEEALLGTVAEQAGMGLLAPLVTFVDLRQLLGLGLDHDHVLARAGALGLSRALYGAGALVSHFFPEVADAAARVRPALGLAERLAVERVVEAAKDPARLRHLRGADAAARLVVAP